MFCTTLDDLLKSNMALVTRTHIIWILLLVISLVSCRRQKPQHDEIERVFNETHSIIWKCSVAECPRGMGLSVPCGTSVPYSASFGCVDCVDGANSSATHDYSQCKSCMKCSANEKISGHCTTKEDTTKCLKTCHKGFYWDSVTDSCHSCSDCCVENLKLHEEQCEKSGLSISHQCRQTHVICQRPTTGRRETLGMRITTANNTKHDFTDDPSDVPYVVPNDDPKQISPSSKIAGIVIGCILFAVVIVLGVVIWKFCGWQLAKTIFKNCCFCNQGLIYDVEGNDSESAPCFSSGSHLEEADTKECFIPVPTNPELPDDVIVQNPGAEREEKPKDLQCTSTTRLDHHIVTINPALEFQRCLLSKRMATIPIQYYRKICNKLDVSREFWDDYRMFGEKIGLNRDEISLLGQSGKPTDSMIMQKFDSQRDSSIGKFKEIMEEMERNDVVTVIKEWVFDEWEKRNDV